MLAVSLGKLNNKQKHTISLALFIGLLMTVVRSGVQVVITKFDNMVSFSYIFKRIVATLEKNSFRGRA